VKRDLATLTQILDRIERVESSGLDRERFLRNEWDQDAVLRNLEVIGEAVKRLTSGVRSEPSKVRWSEFAGFRDIAIHAYDTVNLERTWSVVENDLPVLKAEIRRLLHLSEPESPD